MSDKIIFYGLEVVSDTKLDPQKIYVHPFAEYRLYAESPANSTVVGGEVAPLKPEFIETLERIRKRDQNGS